ncbi:hypothetical protein V8E51_008584 [Hyaloscypha variabilis]
MHFLSICSLHFTLRRYGSCSIMSSPKFVLTSLPSQPSGLEDGLVLSNTEVGFVHSRLPAEPSQQSEEVRAHEVAIGVQKTVKQICDEDRRRFEQLYDEERQREA